MRGDREIHSIDASKTYPDLHQPRKHFDLSSIAELSKSIKTNGLIKPILVERVTPELRNEPGLESMLLEFDDLISQEFLEINGTERKLNDEAYLIVYGHRRFEAHWRGGVSKIRARISQGLSKKERLALQLAEDSQEAIPAHEVAQDIIFVYKSLCDLSGQNIPLTQLSKRLGRSDLEIKRAFQYWNLDANIKNAVMNGKFDYTKAAEIGRVRNFEEQSGIFTKVMSEKLSLKGTRELVDKYTIFDDVVLNESALLEIRSRKTEDLKRLQQEYTKKAICELKNLISEEGPISLLKPDFVKNVKREMKFLDLPSKEQFLRTQKPKLIRRLHEDVRIQTLNQDLFGNPILETQENPYTAERMKFYSLLNCVYTKVATFFELVKVDPELSKMFTTISKNVGGNIRDALNLLSEFVPEKHHSNSGRYDMRGKSKFTLEDYIPAYKFSDTIDMIPLNKLSEDELNVRRTFCQESLENLADNIATNGLQEPLLVEPTKNGYKIITGHRRYRASKLAGLNLAECIVINDLKDVDRKILQIIEDSQKPFTATERARHWYQYYKMLNAEQVEKGENLLSIDAFAKTIGRKPAAIRNAFSFLSLSPRIMNLTDLGLLNYTSAVEISYLPQRIDSSKKDYSFNPNSEFYLKPEQVFCQGQNKHEGLQYQIALKTAYHQLTKKQLKELVDTAIPEITIETQLPFANIDQIQENNARKNIITDLTTTLQNFSGNVRVLIGGEKDAEYCKNVYRHPTLGDKYQKLRETVGNVLD